MLNFSLVDSSLFKGTLIMFPSFRFVSASCFTVAQAIAISLLLTSCGSMGDDATLVAGEHLSATTPTASEPTQGKSNSATSSNDEIARGVALVKRGDVYHQLGKQEEALKSYRQALAIFKTVGDKVAETETLKKIQTIQPSPQP